MEELKLNKDLIWSSDWGGDEVGYDHVLVVGLYQVKGTEIHLYIDMEELEVLEAWEYTEDDCDTQFDPEDFLISY